MSQRDEGGPSPQTNTAHRVLNALIIIFSQSSQALAVGGIALFLPLIRRDLGLTFTEAGTVSAAATAVYALMQIPSGFLADRFGAKRLFLIGLLGTNILSFNLAQLHDYRSFIANQAASGFFRSLLFAPGLLLISSLFPPGRRATAMGLYVAGGFSSNILLNTLGPVLVTPFGWRTLFEAFSAAGLVILLVLWRFGTKGPSGSGKGGKSIRTIFRLFRYRVMWVVGGIQYVRLAVALGLTFWMPTYLVLEKHQSLQTAGLLVAMGAALTAPSNFLGGYLSDRLANPLLVIGTSLAMLALTILLLVPINSLPLLLLVVGVNSIFIQLYFGPLFAVPVAMLGPKTAGLTSGFGNFFANLGGVTFAFALGAIKDRTGSFDLGLYALAGLCVIGLLLTILLWRMKPIHAV